MVVCVLERMYKPLTSLLGTMNILDEEAPMQELCTLRWTQGEK